jgi:hypothetical protein
MTSELDVDRVLEDWFAQGPSRLPDRVISETVEQLDHIKRRRYLLPPGRERMTRLLIAGTGLAAALVAAAVGFATLTGGTGIGGPGGVTYTSDRHGYSVFLPDGWTVEERPGTWGLGQFFDANSEAGVDYFEEDLDADGVPTLYVYLASQDIPDGTSFEDWLAGHDVATTAYQPCFELVGAYENRLVDGETARMGTYQCDDFDGTGIPYTGVQTMVAYNGRGYAIYVWPAPLPGFRPAGWEDMPVPELQAAAGRWLDAVEFTD